MERIVTTKCGWTGSLRKSDSVGTALTSRCGSEHDVSSSSYVENESRMEWQGDEWFGGEPPLFSRSVEADGVRAIMAALSPPQKLQMEAFDKTMPIRHFRAEKGDTAKAISQIQFTLTWRKDFGVDVITTCFSVQGTSEDSDAHKEMREVLAAEATTGKIYIRGYDLEGRAFMFMTPGRENTNNELNNMRHLVYNLEKAICCTRRKSVECMATACRSTSSDDNVLSMQRQPFEKVNLVIDYEGFKLQNAPPMSTTRYTLDILQKHYPERMRHAYLLHPPIVFRAFWSLIKSFVDPVTKEKIVFCSGSGGKEKLTDLVLDKAKLEERAYGKEASVRPFDSIEYMNLPYGMAFDE